MKRILAHQLLVFNHTNGSFSENPAPSFRGDTAFANDASWVLWSNITTLDHTDTCINLVTPFSEPRGTAAPRPETRPWPNLRIQPQPGHNSKVRRSRPTGVSTPFIKAQTVDQTSKHLRWPTYSRTFSSLSISSKPDMSRKTLFTLFVSTLAAPMASQRF